MFVDTKGGKKNRSHKAKNRQCNDQTIKNKRTNNNLQNTTQKTKDRATRTPLRSEGELQIDNQFLLH